MSAASLRRYHGEISLEEEILGTGFVLDLLDDEDLIRIAKNIIRIVLNVK